MGGLPQAKPAAIIAPVLVQLARGESLARVMSMVGHHQLKTTNGYLRKAGVDVKGGTDKLGYKLPRVNEAQIIKLLKQD